MPPRAVLLDLYDTLVDGDWQGWRTELSTLTGIDEDTLGMAYHLTREERNTGAYPTSEDSIRDCSAAGHDVAERGPRARRRAGRGSLRRRDPPLRRFAADGRRLTGTRGSHRAGEQLLARDPAHRGTARPAGVVRRRAPVVRGRRSQARARYLPGRADGAGRRARPTRSSSTIRRRTATGHERSGSTPG